MSNQLSIKKLRLMLAKEQNMMIKAEKYETFISLGQTTIMEFQLFQINFSLKLFLFVLPLRVFI
ncbi:CLUMA_CG006704, isoform A [Clunio marinus]|uniref:CLUMA_CG006704, isoform A n=1 Tax=Clunio marinus TaxID=568069 RepID=A0A1J1HY65_9DIPT|nr:CLUMA_CG006704, isoform A [Clunio marinus]